MAILLPDVTFPAHRDGYSTAVRSDVPLAIQALSGCTITAESWSQEGMMSPGWRLYLNLDPGAFWRTTGRWQGFLPGCLYLIPAWLPWEGRCDNPVRHFNAMIDLPSLPRSRVELCCPALVCLSQATEPLARQWQGLAAELATGGAVDLVRLSAAHAAVWSALESFFAGLPRAQALWSGLNDLVLVDLLRWIDEHLSADLSRAALATYARCSEGALAKRFQRELGTTPAAWVRSRRIARAADLLRSTNWSIEAIGTECGLGDRTQFSRVFHRELGRSPAAWRKIHAANQ